jgi:hypothetical protein
MEIHNPGISMEYIGHLQIQWYLGEKRASSREVFMVKYQARVRFPSKAEGNQNNQS